MILVTGSTGFVGRNMVRKLLQENQKVRCLVRKTSNLSIFDGLELEYSEGDITQPQTLPKAMEGIDTVINLVGIIREGKNVTFEKIHAEGTANVVDAAKKGGIKKFVQMSALGTGAQAVSRYHKTKWQGEEAVRASGLEYVIFRPSIICGADDKFVNMFARMIRQTFLTRMMPVIGSGKYKMQPIYVGDVAHCFVTAACRGEKQFATTYELGGPEQLTFNEILNTIMRVMGKRRIKVHLPLWVGKILAFFMEKLLSAPPLTREQLTMLQIDNICDITAMKSDFDFEPMRFEDAIRTYLS
ncbi:MAG TPA: complex I NDUFA9 subunit family protein [Candidatus Brocadiia bacterium]|nr:complex I NDUFA9 subunit family protein [Candidatus Brocadiales bacterium]